MLRRKTRRKTFGVKSCNIISSSRSIAFGIHSIPNHEKTAAEAVLGFGKPLVYDIKRGIT